jgi:N-acetyl-gamma-glutamyl-phosphate reductase
MMHIYAQQKRETQDVKVGVVGCSGYAGLELIRLLMKHPKAALRACFSTTKSFSFADYLPAVGAKEIPVVEFERLDAWCHELDTVFLATPAEVSLETIPRLVETGVNVIDLSGAFRLKKGGPDAYRTWYGIEHPAPTLLDRAEYGLLPWLGPVQEASRGRLIANPGCYATSVLMALLPLLKRGLILPETIVIDAKSGASGAGRKAAENLLFTEVEGECLPYRIGRHQHLPEIREFAENFSAVKIAPFFTTHLLGIRRGILTGIYAKVPAGVTEETLSAAFATDYSDYGLVDWGPLTGISDRASAFRLSLKRVVGTAQTNLHYKVDGENLYLFSLIDNLIKGAAGQAVENFNRIHGLPFGAGLVQLEGVL